MKLRITPDGTVRGLWDDSVDWPSLGRISVKRASHVEFCDRMQLWCVRSSHPRIALHQLLQWMLRRPFGEILHRAATRLEALAWEREHFAPGGPGWPGRGTGHARQQLE